MTNPAYFRGVDSLMQDRGHPTRRERRAFLQHPKPRMGAATMPKRFKRPSRLAWFAFEPDAFNEDDRMRPFTNKEKCAWAFLLINSFRAQGFMSSDPAVISGQTGLSLKESQAMVAKLLVEQLLIPTGKLYEAYSPRMVTEYGNAAAAYATYSNKGKKSAEKNGTANLKREVIARHVSEPLSEQMLDVRF